MATAKTKVCSMFPSNGNVISVEWRYLSSFHRGPARKPASHSYIWPSQMQNEKSLSPSLAHIQTTKVKQEDVTLEHCPGIVSVQTLFHQKSSGMAMETHTARVLHHRCLEKVESEVPNAVSYQLGHIQNKKGLWD